MNDPCLMRRVESREHLRRDEAHPLGREPAAARHGGAERLPHETLHHEERRLPGEPLKVRDLHDICVPKAGRGLRLALKSRELILPQLALRRVQHLHRDGPT